MKTSKTGVSMGSIIVKVPKCKRDYSRTDYKLTRKERKQAKLSNDISIEERRERGTYNSGFGTIAVEKADLSKYREMK